MHRLAIRLRVRLALALMRHRGHIERIVRDNGEVAYRLTKAGEQHFERKAAA